MAISIVQINNNLKTLDFLTETGWHKVAFEDFSDEVKGAVATINAAALNLRPIEERQLDEARQEQQKLADENASVRKENETVKQENESVKQENKQLEEANSALKMAVNRIFTADESKAYINTYQEYQANHLYGQGEIFRYNGKLFITTQSHTSQENWRPDATPALYIPFEVVGKSEGGDTPKPITDFKQPTGAHDAYKKGDKVRYEGKVYECLVDNCTYSPSGYPEGWKVVE